MILEQLKSKSISDVKSTTGCIIELATDYETGSIINSTGANTSKSWMDCKTFCRTNAAKYFTWMGPTYSLGAQFDCATKFATKFWDMSQLQLLNFFVQLLLRSTVENSVGNSAANPVAQLNWAPDGQANSCWCRNVKSGPISTIGRVFGEAAGCGKGSLAKSSKGMGLEPFERLCEPARFLSSLYRTEGTMHIHATFQMALIPSL